jgi:hypothetical protein
MSDQNRDDGWTVNSLREHLLQLREADRRYFGEAIEYADRSLDAVSRLMEKYEALLTENKFNFLTRVEYDAKHEPLRFVGDVLERRIATLEGQKSGKAQSWALIVAGISTLLNVLLVAKILTN